MGSTPTTPRHMREAEKSAQELGLQFNLKQAEVDKLINYYKRKDPHNRGLLPQQFKEAAGKFLASELTIDPDVVFNIFDIHESGVVGKVTMREFVLGYAILSRGSTENRLRYIFSLYAGNTNSAYNTNNSIEYNDNGSSSADTRRKDIPKPSSPSNLSTIDFLTRDQLMNCLRLIQRIVTEVADDDSDDVISDNNDAQIREVADNLIAESETGRAFNSISYVDFIEKLKQDDVVTNWLDKLSAAAGDHLRYMDSVERDAVDLYMERTGILHVSMPRSPSHIHTNAMDWTPASPSADVGDLYSKEGSADSSTKTGEMDSTVVKFNVDTGNGGIPTSNAERKRKIPLPRNHSLVRRDLQQQLQKQQKVEHNSKQQVDVDLEESKSLQSKQLQRIQRQRDQQIQSNSQSNDEQDDEEINAAKPFLINYYQIEFGKVLGRGACATVYEGTWLHIPVAVKRFHDRSGEPASRDGLGTLDEEARKAIVGDYVEEFWLLLQIRHPNCLLYMGICFEPYVCIVTELFSGGSVASYLHGPNAKTFSPTKAIEMISCVARGMYYLHASSPPILHRDLKASNILIDRMISHCVICDFGLSRQFVKEASGIHVKNGDSKRVSEPGTIGTPYTMAPEIIDQKEYTPAADVYSFGIVMYEMYTGRYPFPNMKPVQLMFHVSEGKRPEFLDSDEIPPTLRVLIEKCWAQELTDRPTFEEILEQLDSKELKEELSKAQKSYDEKNGKQDSNVLAKRLLDVAFLGEVEELKSLIHAGADVNYSDYDKRTALHIAAAEGKVDCMRALLLANAVSRRDRWNNLPIVDAQNYAERTGDNEPVRILREHDHRRLSNTDIEDIVNEKVDMEQDEMFRHYRALTAASRGNVDTLRKLLNDGLDVNLRDYDRRTLLMVAASEGQSEVAQLLLEYGAKVRSRDRWGCTAYKEGERCGHHGIMLLIRQAGERAGSDSPELTSKPALK